LSGSYSDSRRSLYTSKGSLLSSSEVNSWTTVENLTGLHVAAHAGHADLVDMLLSKYHVRTLSTLTELSFSIIHRYPDVSFYIGFCAYGNKA
jgi:hypothetical protein